MGIGLATSNAQKKTGLPWPTNPITGIPSPYAGAAPISTPTTATSPTTSPTTVSQALQNTTNTVDQAKASLASTQPFLDNYLKPNVAGTTPFRQALTNTKASSTADAYDNAISQARNKAQSMGFSSNSQPVTFGAEAGLANERAKAIADIPNKVNLEAQPVEFQAAAMQQQQPGILNALANTQQSQTNTLSAEEMQAKTIAEQQRAQAAAIAEQQREQAAAQKGALASGLATTAISAGVPLIKAALTKTVAPTVAKLAAPAVAGGVAAGAGGGAAATGSAAAASAAASGVASGGSVFAAPSALAPSGGGLGSALGALASNPATWAVAGAITAAIIWKKSQVHPTADTFVKGFQDPFANAQGTGHLNKVVDSFNQALATGKLDKASAQAAYEETAKLIDQFKQDTNTFAQKGGKENTVAMQSAATMRQYFGDNFGGILDKMKAEIAALPGAA